MLVVKSQDFVYFYVKTSAHGSYIPEKSKGINGNKSVKWNIK